MASELAVKNIVVKVGFSTNILVTNYDVDISIQPIMFVTTNCVFIVCIWFELVNSVDQIIRSYGSINLVAVIHLIWML